MSQPVPYTTKRGHHKIIIGAAPGVGKTYRMLEEAHHQKKLGLDVVIGYLEAHGRHDTEILAAGLEVVLRQVIPYKSIQFEEMDKNAIIVRKPELVLVDELAHTNARGSENTKRYEDVQDILNAGINVVSTLNIQHIESLNDLVSRITGVQMNERVPDWVMDDAEVVMVDISSDELQERLKKGKIYASEKIEQALGNFFKKGNLVALRELALREVANTVEEQAEQDVLSCPIEPTGIHERILVCISSHPNSQRLIRRGFRIADRMCGELFVVFVYLKGRDLPDEFKRTLHQHQHLTEELGGQFIEVRGNSIVDAIVDLSKERKVTQVIVGESLKEGKSWNPFNVAIPYQIFKRTQNIDVYIIASD